MNANRDVVALAGRVLLAFLFVFSGWGKLTGFAGAVGYITSVHLPMPEAAAALTIAAASEHAHGLRPSDQIPLTRNEIAHLLIQRNRCGERGSRRKDNWRRSHGNVSDAGSGDGGSARDA